MSYFCKNGFNFQLIIILTHCVYIYIYIYIVLKLKKKTTTKKKKKKKKKKFPVTNMTRASYHNWLPSLCKTFWNTRTPHIYLKTYTLKLPIQSSLEHVDHLNWYTQQTYIWKIMNFIRGCQLLDTFFSPYWPDEAKQILCNYVTDHWTLRHTKESLNRVYPKSVFNQQNFGSIVNKMLASKSVISTFFKAK